jgi:arylsulfatase A-like enzyme
MPSRLRVAVALLALAVFRPAYAAKPNIVFILADDLGYGDLGVTNQNGRGPDQARFTTPNLDALAAGGMLLRQHYTGSPVCAPARGSLLLGQHQGDCPIRDNQFDKALPDNHTLATVLRAAGYHTVAIGKWGLQGAAPDYPGHPLRHGFDEFFGFLAHNSGHVYYHDAQHPLHDGFTDVTAQYTDVYSTDLFTARAKRFLVDHTAAHPAEPFFLYLAYTAPHNPQGVHGGMQWPVAPAPGETRDKWLEPAYQNATFVPAPGKPRIPWWPRMKRYATVIHRLDQGVGDVVQTLKDLHLDGNTLVVFTSDNGPSNEGIDPRSFQSWGPFDGFKRDVWEGGVREPTIASWPGHVAAGTTTDAVSSFEDWMPTFADLAGLAPPAQSDGVPLTPTLLGRPGQRDRGFVYTEYFYPSEHPKTGPLADIIARKGPARGQQQVLRLGDDVAIRLVIRSADDPLRLYDVVHDPHQDHDLSGDPKYAAILTRARALLPALHRPAADAKRPYDDAAIPAVPSTGETGSIRADGYAGAWPWVPDLDGLTPTRSETVHGFDPLPDASATRFTGSLAVATTGTYTFWLTTDTGAEFWVQESHVIDDDFANTGATVSARVTLAAGSHPFHLFYRHKAGTPSLKLEYAGPGVERQTVPASALRMPQSAG